jgi:arginyl-tRNA synthetase
VSTIFYQAAILGSEVAIEKVFRVQLSKKVADTIAASF